MKTKNEPRVTFVNELDINKLVKEIKKEEFGLIYGYKKLLDNL